MVFVAMGSDEKISARECHDLNVCTKYNKTEKHK